MAETDIVVKLDIEGSDKLKTTFADVSKSAENNFDKTSNSSNKAKTAFNDLGNEIKGNFTNAIRGAIVSLAGFAVINKTIGFLKEARQESQNYKLAVNQLTAGLGYYSSALIKQAEALEKTMMVDAGETLAAQARLSFYFKEEAIIQKLTPAVLNLARAKGMNLTSAANMLAVSFQRGSDAAGSDEASIRGLGIEFKKTGDQAKDLDSMLLALNSKLSGQAQAVYDSLDGWDKLGFKIKNATEDFGKLLFGVSKNTERANEYEAALALIDGGIKKSIVSYSQYGAIQREGVDVTQQQIDNAKKLVKAYEEEQETLKNNAIETSKIEQERKVSDIARSERQKSEIQRLKELKTARENAEKAAFDAYRADSDAALQAQFDKKKEIQDASDRDAARSWQYQVDTAQNASDEILSIEQNATAAKQNIMAAENNIREQGQMAFMNSLRVLAGESKVFLIAYKAQAIAQVTIDTIRAAQAAWAWGTGIAGPIGGAAAAGVVGLAGVVNVGKIVSAKLARGTSSAPGGYSMVGEEGPEMMYVPQGSQIYNSNTTRNMVSNNNSNVTVNVLGSNGQVVETLRSSLRAGSADGFIRDFKRALAVA